MVPDFQTCSDGELAGRCQDGSLPAFEELVYRYEGRIYGFVANVCGNAADAREVTQDTFVRAFQAIAQFDGEHSFAPWLFAIARRKCIDRYRSAPRRAEEPVPEQMDEDDPAELLAREEERQNLWGLARRRLPEPQFEVLWLRYSQGMSVAEISQALHKTQTHVKVLLFRARRVLARELKAGQGTGVAVGRVGARPAPVWKATHSSIGGEQHGVGPECAAEFSGIVVGSTSSDGRKGCV